MGRRDQVIEAKAGAASTATASFVAGAAMLPQGVVPAIALIRPKYPHNVGAAVRAASCFGVRQVWFSGDRVSLDPNGKDRLPREERMRGYKDVELRQHDRIFDHFPGAVPVAVEVKENAELLTTFEHPDDALYVFGPEDGSLDKGTLCQCHRFVIIPTKHCTNLSAAVYLVLYDRLIKRILAGKEPPQASYEVLDEQRGFME